MRTTYGRNPFILKWWTPLNDRLLSGRMERQLWYWYADFKGEPPLSEELASLTPPEVLEIWNAEDPNCSQLGWRSTLWHFALDYAYETNMEQTRIRAPLRKVCLICSGAFLESSLSASFVQWLGVDHIDFCNPCLAQALYANSGKDDLSREQILESLQELARVLQRVPTEDYFKRGISRLSEICEYSPAERVAILGALKQKPTGKRIKDLFGSWFKALVEAGILEDGTRRNRGTQCLARDGHMCFSLGEKTIDDLLNSLSIAHEREPRYPEGNFRADFIVNGVFIEYLGLEGNADYDAKTNAKQKICQRHQIRLISIHRNDLMNSNALKTKLMNVLSEQAQSESIVPG